MSTNVSPRGILKTAASRAAARSQQHEAQTTKLIEKRPLLYKVLVVGGLGVGKSSLLRAANGDFLLGEELSQYTPTSTPHFTTVLCERAHEGRVVYLQLWEVPFPLLAAEAASFRNGSVGFPYSSHLDVAISGAQGVLLVVDAQEGHVLGRTLRTEFFINSPTDGKPQKHSWNGGSLAACDLAQGVLRRRVKPSCPFFLIFHKADHAATLAASLAPSILSSDSRKFQQRLRRQKEVQSMVHHGQRKWSGVVEDFFGTERSGVDARDVASTLRNGGNADDSSWGAEGSSFFSPSISATPDFSAAHVWTRASVAVPGSGYGRLPPYLLFQGGGLLTHKDIKKFASACKIEGWGWSSSLSSASDTPLGHLNPIHPGLKASFNSIPAPSRKKSFSSQLIYSGGSTVSTKPPLPTTTMQETSISGGRRDYGMGPTWGEEELKHKLEALLFEPGKPTLMPPFSSVKLLLAQIAWTLTNLGAP